MKLLRIDSSPFDETALSRGLTDEFVHKWLAENHHGTVIPRDLNKLDIPVVNAAWGSANYTLRDSRTHLQN